MPMRRLTGDCSVITTSWAFTGPEVCGIETQACGGARRPAAKIGCGSVMVLIWVSWSITGPDGCVIDTDFFGGVSIFGAGINPKAGSCKVAGIKFAVSV